MCTAISNYCGSALPSTIHANAPTTYSATIGSSVSYTCDFGYNGAPSITCNAFNSTDGVWNSISGNCTRAIKLKSNIRFVGTEYEVLGTVPTRSFLEKITRAGAIVLKLLSSKHL